MIYKLIVTLDETGDVTPSETSEGEQQQAIETQATEQDIYNLLSDIKVIDTAILMVCVLILFFSYFRKVLRA